MMLLCWFKEHVLFKWCDDDSPPLVKNRDQDHVDNNPLSCYIDLATKDFKCPSTPVYTGASRRLLS